MADEQPTVATNVPEPYVGRARYVKTVGGQWSLHHLEFDPPFTLPAHCAARYSTPAPPDDPADDGPSSWFPVRITFERRGEVPDVR